MKHYSIFRFTKVVFIIFSLSMVATLFTGCKKDEENKIVECDNYVSLGSTATINGIKNSLYLAKLLISAESGGDLDLGTMSIGGFTSDCNENKHFTLYIYISPGAKLNGTYNIDSFADIEINEAFGYYSENKITPLSQSLEDFSSGSVKITDKGSKLYSIDLIGKTVIGEEVTFKGDVQF